MAGARAQRVAWDTSGYMAAINAVLEGGRATQRGSEVTGGAVGAGLTNLIGA